jgi:clan AA aspartic protease
LSTFKVEISVTDLTMTQERRAEALVDTGASYAALPTSVLQELGILPVERRRFVLADGRAVEYDVGFALVGIDGRRTPTIVVFAEESAPPLLGALVLEGLGFTVDPLRERLVAVDSYLL